MFTVQNILLPYIFCYFIYKNTFTHCFITQYLFTTRVYVK